MGAFFPVILLTPTPISSAHNLYLFQMLELQENITDSQVIHTLIIEVNSPNFSRWIRHR